MQNYSYGIAAVGLLAGMLPLALGYMFSGQFAYETLFKSLLMAGLFVNYPTLVRLADDVFKQPDIQIEQAMHDQSGGGLSLVNAYVDAYNAAVDKYYDAKKDKADMLDIGSKVAIAIDRALNHVAIYIWLAIAMVINMLLDLVLFLLKFASLFGAELLIALAPLSFAISFFKGFEGSLVGVLKYIFVFRLWAAVAAAIKFAAYNIGFFNLAYKFHAQIDAGAIPVSPDWSILILQAAFIILILMTPMFADALIAGSQSGAFFSAAMAKGASMLSPAISGAKALGGHVYKSSGAQMGAQAAGKMMQKVPSAESIGHGIAKKAGGLLGMKSPTSSPNKNNNKS
jgi:hypothetical protein